MQSTPFRIKIPNEIVRKLKASESDHIGFYEVDEEIVVKEIDCNPALIFLLNLGFFIPGI